MLTAAGTMFVVVVLAVLSSCYAATDSNGSNERDFYIILEGLGPTGGSSMNSPDTLWARTLVWGDDGEGGGGLRRCLAQPQCQSLLFET